MAPPNSASWYGEALAGALLGQIDLSSATLKIMLLDNTYTPGLTHQFKADLSGEVSGTGYTAGGAALTNPTVVFDSAGVKAVFDADDVSWPSADGFAARYAAIYDDGPATDAEKPLVLLVDLGSDISADGTFDLLWPSSGIGQIGLSGPSGPPS